jgi:outer membrane protein assembly factor BamD
MKKIGILSVFFAVLLLSACGSKEDDSETKPLESAEKLYNEAREKFDAKDYKEAAKAYDEVERQHPSSEWANNAQIMSAYSSYKVADYDTATGTLDRYVKLYPNSDSTPYAYYLIALCYYEQISDVGRDQKMTEKALQALREVGRRFPDTEYAHDAKLKQDLTIDHLAGKEMEIGRYYLRHDDYLAAVNRFRYVVETYQTTTHAPEALHRLVECYLKLGVPDEAMRYASVLGYNYPGSVWYKDTYKLMTSDVAKPIIPVPVEATAAVATPAPAPAADKKAPPPPISNNKTSWWNFWSDASADDVKPAEPAEPKPAPAAATPAPTPAAAAPALAPAPVPAAPAPAEPKPAETAPAPVAAVPAEIKPPETAAVTIDTKSAEEAAPESKTPWWNVWSSPAEEPKPAEQKPPQIIIKPKPDPAAPVVQPAPAAQTTPADTAPVDAQTAPAGTKSWWDFMTP